MGSRLAWVADVSVGAWIAPRLTPLDGRVGSVVPRGFPACARVLHPVKDPEGEPTTWAAVCEVTHRTPHALAQWASNAAPPVEDGSGRPPSSGRPWAGEEPAVGELEPSALQRLCRVLAGHTGDGTACVFALWEGYGWIHGSPAVALYPTGRGGSSTDVPPAFDQQVLSGPRLHLPGRDYLLFTGPLEAARDLGWRPAPGWFVPQSPSLFWPQDRSWCVATEIDLDSTLVAGDAALVDDVLADPGLESWPVGPDDLVDARGDAVNT